MNYNDDNSEYICLRLPTINILTLAVILCCTKCSNR